MLITFLICYIAIIYVSFMRKSSKLIISPIFWLIGAWTLIIGLYFTTGIKYKYSLKFYTGVYLIFILVNFVIFYYIGLKTTLFQNKKIKNCDLYYNDEIDMSLYYIITIVGCIMWFFDIYRLNNIVYGYRIDNFSISIIGVLGNIFMMLSLIVWLYDLAAAIRFDRIPCIRAFASAVIYVSPAFITAGRQNLLILILSTFITLVYSLHQNKLYKYRKIVNIIIIIAVPIFVSYLVLISSVRSGSSNKQALFEFVFNSNTPKELISNINKFGGLKEVILEAIYYYSHELPMFEVFFNNYEGPRFWGMFQLHYLSRRLPDFLNLNYDIAWVYLDSMSYKFGLYSHVWRTAIASFIIDFGKVGAFFFAGFLGWLVGYKKKIYIKKNSLYDLVFLTIICVGTAFSIQYSPFNETSWAYPLYWLIIIPHIENIRSKFYIQVYTRERDKKNGILPN